MLIVKLTKQRLPSIFACAGTYNGYRSETTMKHLKDWRVFHNKESSLTVLTENDRPTPPRTRCTFQNVNQPFCGGARLSHSPAARKALPFTFKQQNNNQWSIINAEIILCCYPAECKAAGVGQPVLWIALSPQHGDAAMISVVFSDVFIQNS